MRQTPLRFPGTQESGGLPHILVVTSDPEVRTLLRDQILQVDGVEVSYAESGKQALQSLRVSMPAAVLCDVTLSDLDGFQLARLLKLPLLPGTERLPVVLFSASYRDVLAEHVARKTGAFAFLKLPVDTFLVPRTIELVLHRTLAGQQDHMILTHKGDVQIAGTDDLLIHGTAVAAERDGWKVKRGTSLLELAESWGAAESHVVVFEHPRRGSLDFPTDLLKQLDEPPVLIALLWRSDPELLQDLMEHGVDDFVMLPASPEQIVASIGDARLKFNFRSIHKQFEQQFEKLQEVSDYLELVITHSHEAIFACDPDGRVRLWNKGAERVYGYTAEEAIGSIVDDLVDPPGFTRKSPHVIRMLIQRGSMTDPEVERRRKSGEVFPVTATFTLLKDSRGEILGYSVIDRDVTPIKALENEKIKSARLRAITQTAVTANDHINTPLGIILGYAQFLEMKLANVDAQDRAALDVIQQQVHKIKGIMNKLKLISDPIVKNYSIEGVTMLDLTKSQLSNEAAN
ncbi:MAG: PAS domain S-box protein [Calditrichaeota bacterium]|nr:PAS domain S-box protein [Calditrichota bacterium]MCB9366019.1 PAS domain S-box protein [Calditrichota bacterium]MCB9391855.1 PAS domain S-box protein [Calditrichota bacterium]